MTNSPDLSIVILNFNVTELLLNCLDSIYKNKPSKANWQVIVVDNNSDNDPLPLVKKNFPQVETLQTGKNLGFAGGNNFAVAYLKSEWLLFLNPDTIIKDQAIQQCLAFLQENTEYGAISCKVELPNGSLDYSCHRGFPTPWNSLSYFSGLSSLFPKSKFFSGYTASYLNINTNHDIDCISGVFMMIRQDVAKKVGFWDEAYFWNGEDIDFCYRLKKDNWKIYYLASEKIIHYKGSSSGLWSTAKTQVSIETKIHSAKNATSAMRIFYLKHFYNSYPPILRDLVLLGIKILEYYRLTKVNLGLKYK